MNYEFSIVNCLCCILLSSTFLRLSRFEACTFLERVHTIIIFVKSFFMLVEIEEDCIWATHLFFEDVLCKLLDRHWATMLIEDSHQDICYDTTLIAP